MVGCYTMSGAQVFGVSSFPVLPKDVLTDTHGLLLELTLCLPFITNIQFTVRRPKMGALCNIHPGLPWTKGLPGVVGFHFKTGTILDKAGQIIHPRNS